MGPELEIRDMEQSPFPAPKQSPRSPWVVQKSDFGGVLGGKNAQIFDYPGGNPWILFLGIGRWMRREKAPRCPFPNFGELSLVFGEPLMRERL